MKRIMLIGIITVIFLISTLTVYASEIGKARISLIEGDVLISTQDTGNEWAAASINIPMVSGDKVWVPRNGRTEIQFIGRTYLRAYGTRRSQSLEQHGTKAPALFRRLSLRVEYTLTSVLLEEAILCSKLIPHSFRS